MSDIENMLEAREYGVRESNPITEEMLEVRRKIDHNHPVDLDDSRLRRVTRLRLVTDPGFPMYDLSYCYGELKDGTPVRIILPRYQFSKRNLKGDIIQMCREVRVYAKGLGLLDPETISILAG